MYTLPTDFHSHWRTLQIYLFSQAIQVLMSFSFASLYSHSYTLIFVTVYERCCLTCLASLVIKEGSNEKIASQCILYIQVNSAWPKQCLWFVLICLTYVMMRQRSKPQNFQRQRMLTVIFTSVHVNFSLIYPWLLLYTAIWGKEKLLLKTLCYVFRVSASFMKPIHES